MKKIAYTIICIFGMLSANAQVKVEYSAGYGCYKMSDMKGELGSILTELKTQYPLDIAITDNFPNYVTHSIGVSYILSKHELGANLTYQTTAGRLAYSDYSGVLVDKLTLNAYRIGLCYRYHFHQFKLSEKASISFYGELSPGIAFSNLKSKGYIKVDNTSIDLDDKYRIASDMVGFSVLPQIGGSLSLPYGIGIQGSAGYDFNMGESTKHNKDIKADWSGFRISGGISYLLPF